MNEVEGSGCILFFKMQDTLSEKYPLLQKEDFILIIMTDAQCEILRKYGRDCICIDSTHGLNAYDFQLTTLLVLDDMREGFPCCFMISNHTDEKFMSIFFHEIKSTLEVSLNPKVFV